MKTMNYEGFWRSSSEPELPMPQVQPDPWLGQRDFEEALEAVEDHTDVVCYRGWSQCRICGAANGNREHVYKDWSWPSGFKHYVEDHNVEPSLEFKAFILAEVE